MIGVNTRESCEDISQINRNSAQILINEMSTTFDDRFQNNSEYSNMREMNLKDTNKRVLKSDPDMIDQNSDLGIIQEHQSQPQFKDCDVSAEY